MADKERFVVYAAAYDSVQAAMSDLDAVEQLHKDQMIGRYDAAVISNEEGRPHVARRMDRPRLRVIPEWFGGGTLPRRELHEAAAAALAGNEAGLIVIGEPAIVKGLDRALTNATSVVTGVVEATTDEITRELGVALSGSAALYGPPPGPSFTPPPPGPPLTPPPPSPSSPPPPEGDDEPEES